MPDQPQNPPRPSPTALLKLFRTQAPDHVKESIRLFNFMDAREKMELLLFMQLAASETAHQLMQNIILLAKGIDRLVADVNLLKASLAVANDKESQDDQPPETPKKD